LTTYLVPPLKIDEGSYRKYLKLSDKFANNMFSTAEGEITAVIKTTTSYKCPVDDPRYSGMAEPGGQGAYRLVDGQCYFFERNTMTYEEAKVNCGTKFGSSGMAIWVVKFSKEGHKIN
jgi:hypothetical protein